MDDFLCLACLRTLAGQLLALCLQGLRVHCLCAFQKIFLFSDRSISSGQFLLPVCCSFSGLFQCGGKCLKFLLQCGDFLLCAILIWEGKPVTQCLDLSGQFLLPAAGTC